MDGRGAILGVSWKGTEGVFLSIMDMGCCRRIVKTGLCRYSHPIDNEKKTPAA
jgi:hypothetical protein